MREQQQGYCCLFVPVDCGNVRPETQRAPGAVRLRTREYHSALNAMRPLAKERKRNRIYPGYSGISTSLPAKKCVRNRIYPRYSGMAHPSLHALARR
jgi:hypothetical protein